MHQAKDIPSLYTPVIRLLWPALVEAGVTHQVDPVLLLSLAWVDTGFDTTTLDVDGRAGLFAMPQSLAAGLAGELRLARVNLAEPATAIRLAAFHLGRLSRRFHHNLTPVLLAWRLGVQALAQPLPVLRAKPKNARYLQQALSVVAWATVAEPWKAGAVVRGTPLPRVYQSLALGLRKQSDTEKEETVLRLFHHLDDMAELESGPSLLQRDDRPVPDKVLLAQYFETIRQAFPRLTSRQREAVTLVGFQHLSERDAAERMRLTISSFHELLQRAAGKVVQS